MKLLFSNLGEKMPTLMEMKRIFIYPFKYLRERKEIEMNEMKRIFQDNFFHFPIWDFK